MKTILPVVLALSLLFFVGCSSGTSGSGTPNPNAPEGTFQFIQANVFATGNCLSCHGANSSTGYDFSSYSSLMASGVVVAGNAQDSPLFQQISTGAMPQGGQKLPQSLIDATGQWIQNGAPNN